MGSTYNPDLHHRRSIRLRGYDYSQTGLYFVTICTWNRICLFGEAVDGEMRLNDYGQVVEEEWRQTAVVRPYVLLDAFIVMPNHVHAILVIDDVPARKTAAGENTPLTPRRQFGRPISGSLPTIIGSFKSAVTRRINEMGNIQGTPVWQRNYYEHIIRSEGQLARIRRYIANNPACWAEDEENPFRPV